MKKNWAVNDTVNSFFSDAYALSRKGAIAFEGCSPISGSYVA
jgi:hypothetical protein